MKFSKQRLLIHNAVRDNRIHPTADDVYAILRPQNPNLSLGTVYRNLNNLARNGELLKITMPNGGDRFDADVSNHYHFVCTDCNEVFDLEIPQISAAVDEAVDEAVETLDFEVDSYQLVFNGRCKNCKKKSS